MPAKTVSIIVDREERHIVPGLVMGRDLIQLCHLSATDQLLLEVQGDIDIPVAPSDGILIEGGEQFSIGDGSPTLNDNPCLRHPVHFFFNDRPISPDKAFSVAKVTGAELKHLDPNLQAGDMLFADLNGLADEPIPDDLRIILQKKDRFMTVPCGNVGFNDLLSQHLHMVEAAYSGAHFVEQDGNRYLVVPNFSIPGHWPVSEVTLLSIIPNGYPMAAPDMFWVTPSLTLPSGHEPAGASQREQHLGKTWQRFSWHYTHSQTAWRIGESNLLTHLQFCRARLARVS